MFVSKYLPYTDEWASFELRSAAPKQRSEVEVEGNKARENSNYSPEPRLGSFVKDQ